jgi:hypothetical protein
MECRCPFAPIAVNQEVVWVRSSKRNDPSEELKRAGVAFERCRRAAPFGHRLFVFLGDSLPTFDRFLNLTGIDLRFGQNQLLACFDAERPNETQ